MGDTSLSRRGFLATTGAAVTAGLVSGSAAGANDRIRIGVIGTGGRGRWLIDELGKLREAHNIDVAAVCDVWRPNRESAAARVEELFGRRPFETSRFGEVLVRDDIDAVAIATPDFGHTPIMIEALKAGKDVFVEKPMSLTVEGANEAVELARANERVVQVGTQRRSEGRWVAARQVCESGVLGPITRVSAANCFNHARWARNYDDCKIEDVDWDAYLFNREKVPFDPKLLRRWHLYKMCTNGLSGLWMSHLIDACQIVMNVTYPDSAVALGGIYHWNDGREHSDNFHALLCYETFMFDWCISLTNALPNHYTVHGLYGTLDLDRATWSGEGGASGHQVEGGRLDSVPNVNHVENWLECMRSRERPNGDIEFGRQHSVATIMAAEALHTGRRMRFNSETSEIFAG